MGNFDFGEKILHIFGCSLAAKHKGPFVRFPQGAWLFSFPNFLCKNQLSVLYQVHPLSLLPQSKKTISQRVAFKIAGLTWNLLDSRFFQMDISKVLMHPYRLEKITLELSMKCLVIVLGWNGEKFRMNLSQFFIPFNFECNQYFRTKQ